MSGPVFLLPAIAVFLAHHQPAASQEASHLDRLVEQPATVAAQIQDHAVHAGGLEVLDDFPQPVGSQCIERVQAHIADIQIRADQFVAGCWQVDDRPDNGQFKFLATPPDSQCHLGIDRSPNLGNGSGHAQFGHGFAVHGNHQIPGHQSGLGRRAARERLGDAHRQILFAPFHHGTNTAELALGITRLQGSLLGTQQQRVPIIQIRQHAFDGGLVEDIVVRQITDKFVFQDCNRLLQDIEVRGEAKPAGIRPQAGKRGQHVAGRPGRLRLPIQEAAHAPDRDTQHRQDHRQCHCPPPGPVPTAGRGRTPIGLRGAWFSVDHIVAGREGRCLGGDTRPDGLRRPFKYTRRRGQGCILLWTRF